ncbi:CsbD family protein [Microbacterium gorillae]|uniref:CsbD family protein n=1 Tax=Microbacterium gorillae TaxID=1231063 RepID=UPI000591143C|nr:CsbD family protein [Microbacterium gorillae]
MGIGDDIANNAKEAVGKAKEGLGDALNNEKMEAQGIVDQATAKADKVKDGVKDTINDIKN